MRLGRRHPDLQARPRVEHEVGVARGLAAHDVGEREHRRAGLPGQPHGGQRVGRLARLGDADDQRVRVEHRLAVAELAGDVDLHRHAGQLLDRVAHDEARVVRGAAGDDEHAPQAAQELVAQSHDLGEVDGAVLAEPAGERVAQGGRLLVDLLEHEGLVAGLLGRVVVAGELRLLAHERVAGDVGVLRASGAEGDDVAVLQHHDPARVRQERRDGGGEEHLVVADAHDERALVPGADHDVGLVGGDGAERVVPVHLAQGGAHGARQPLVHVLLDEVRHDLGVRLAREGVPALGEPGAQVLVVLDDAVDHDRDTPGAVGVRVGVLLVGPAVRGPARVPEAGGGRGAVVARGLEQLVQVADGAHHVDAVRLDERDPRGVVAAVLQAPEAVEDDGLAGSTADVAYDAAHACSLLWAGAQRGRLRTAPSSRFVSAVTSGFCRLDNDRAGPGGIRRVFR